MGAKSRLQITPRKFSPTTTHFWVITPVPAAEALCTKITQSLKSKAPLFEPKIFFRCFEATVNYSVLVVEF